MSNSDELTQEIFERNRQKLHNVVYCQSINGCDTSVLLIRLSCPLFKKELGQNNKYILLIINPGINIYISLGNYHNKNCNKVSEKNLEINLNIDIVIWQFKFLISLNI